MAYIEKAVHSRLINHDGLAALVSDQVHRLVIPETGSVPAVTFKMGHVDRTHTMKGTSNLVAVDVDVSSWAKAALLVEQVAEQVYAAMNNWSGQEAGITIHRCLYQTQDDDFEHDTGRYRIWMRFRLWFTEA